MNYLFWLIKLIFFSSKWKPDIIHWQFGFFPLFDLLCIRILKMKRDIRMISTIHDVEPAHRSLNNLLFRRSFFSIFNGLVSHSEKSKKYFLKWMGPLKKISIIKIIPFGPFSFPDTKKFKNINIRKKFNIPQDGQIILSLGTINENKNLEKSLKIIFNLQRKMPLINYIIAGSSGGKSIQKLINLRDKSSFPKKIIIINKFLTDKEVDMLYFIADVSLHNYKTCATSAAAIQSLCMGVPVFCNKLPGFIACVENYINGLILPENNKEATEKIYKVIINRKLLDSLKKGAKNSYADYSWKDIAIMHVDFYSELKKFNKKRI